MTAMALAERALKRAEERNRVLLDVTRAILSNLDRATLFDAIGECLEQVLTMDQTLITLATDDPDVFRVHSLKGRVRAPDFSRDIGRNGSHVGWVAENQRYLLRCCLDETREFDSEDRIYAAGIRSYVVVPLISKGRTLGTLNVGSMERHTYSEDDAVFLQQVGNAVAMAIANMLAYEEIAGLKRRLEEENVYLQEEIRTRTDFEELIGETPTMLQVKRSIETVAPTDATVLITGETGTGKELVARAIHHLSRRRERPFVRVNCAALPEGLIESELFGHEKGAFTGAIQRRSGRFQLADGGTLFLDEVGELPTGLQMKLLRVLQSGEFERLGGSSTRRVNVRVVAATNRKLSAEIASGGFRADLFYRLAVFPVHMPPLRERRDDIPVLVSHFVARHAARMRRSIDTVPTKAMEALRRYDWPGNVRELENVIERAVIVTEGSELHLGKLHTVSPDGDEGAGSTSSYWGSGLGGNEQGLLPTLEEAQRAHVMHALEVTGWKVSGPGGAAELLDVKATTLESRMKRLGIRRPGR